MRTRSGRVSEGGSDRVLPRGGDAGDVVAEAPDHVLDVLGDEALVLDDQDPSLVHAHWVPAADPAVLISKSGGECQKIDKKGPFLYP